MRCGIVGMGTRSVEADRGITPTIAHVLPGIVHGLPPAEPRFEKVPSVSGCRNCASGRHMPSRLLEIEPHRQAQLPPMIEMPSTHSPTPRPRGVRDDWRV